jgi:hypothetical protein
MKLKKIFSSETTELTILVEGPTRLTYFWKRTIQ